MNWAVCTKLGFVLVFGALVQNTVVLVILFTPLFDAGSVLHHAHIDQESTDHCPINDLLTLAGCHPVNFPKDSRVITL